MKNLLLTIILSLSASLSAYSQINFEDRNLAILEKIAFTPSFKTIKGLMKDNNYSFITEDENELDLPNDAFLAVIYLEFKGPIGNTIAVVYDKENKSLLLVVNQIAPVNTVFCEIELKDQSFKIKEESEDEKRWSKNSYKYQVMTDKSEDKIHRLMFLSPSHPEYIK